jgi:hypothetical protein
VGPGPQRRAESGAVVAGGTGGAGPAAGCQRRPGAYGPDGLLDAVDRAIVDVRDAGEVERQEHHEDRDDFLWTQASFDGGLKLYGELSGVRAATVADALHDAAPAITPNSTRAERLAQGLGRVCEGWLAGGPGRTAKPKVDVLVDLSQVTVNAAGTVDLHVNGPLTTLTARTVEALAEDADLRVTLFDGKRPLASSKLRKSPAIPTVIRRVASLRDRGDRMPGSRAPVAMTDVHHVRPRGEGGDHHPPDNVLRLRPRWHHLIHDLGWHNRLDPTTGVFTIERAGRTYRSLPKGTPLARDPEPPGDPPD